MTKRRLVKKIAKKHEKFSNGLHHMSSEHAISSCACGFSYKFITCFWDHLKYNPNVDDCLKKLRLKTKLQLANKHNNTNREDRFCFDSRIIQSKVVSSVGDKNVGKLSNRQTNKRKRSPEKIIELKEKVACSKNENSNVYDLLDDWDEYDNLTNEVSATKKRKFQVADTNVTEQIDNSTLETSCGLSRIGNVDSMVDDLMSSEDSICSGRNPNASAHKTYSKTLGPGIIHLSRNKALLPIHKIGSLDTSEVCEQAEDTSFEDSVPTTVKQDFNEFEPKSSVSTGDIESGDCNTESNAFKLNEGSVQREIDKTVCHPESDLTSKGVFNALTVLVGETDKLSDSNNSSTMVKDCTNNFDVIDNLSKCDSKELSDDVMECSVKINTSRKESNDLERLDSCISNKVFCTENESSFNISEENISVKEELHLSIMSCHNSEVIPSPNENFDSKEKSILNNLKSLKDRPISPSWNDNLDHDNLGFLPKISHMPLKIDDIMNIGDSSLGKQSDMLGPVLYSSDEGSSTMNISSVSNQDKKTFGTLQDIFSETSFSGSVPKETVDHIIQENPLLSQKVSKPGLISEEKESSGNISSKLHSENVSSQVPNFKKLVQKTPSFLSEMKFDYSPEDTLISKSDDPVTEHANILGKQSTDINDSSKIVSSSSVAPGVSTGNSKSDLINTPCRDTLGNLAGKEMDSGNESANFKNFKDIAHGSSEQLHIKEVTSDDQSNNHQERIFPDKSVFKNDIDVNLASQEATRKSDIDIHESSSKVNNLFVSVEGGEKNLSLDEVSSNFELACHKTNLSKHNYLGTEDEMKPQVQLSSEFNKLASLKELSSEVTNSLSCKTMTSSEPNCTNYIEGSVTEKEHPSSLLDIPAVNKPLVKITTCVSAFDSNKTISAVTDEVSVDRENHASSMLGNEKVQSGGNDLRKWLQDWDDDFTSETRVDKDPSCRISEPLVKEKKMPSISQNTQALVEKNKENSSANFKSLKTEDNSSVISKNNCNLLVHNESVTGIVPCVTIPVSTCTVIVPPATGELSNVELVKICGASSEPLVVGDPKFDANLMTSQGHSIDEKFDLSSMPIIFADDAFVAPPIPIKPDPPPPPRSPVKIPVIKIFVYTLGEGQKALSKFGKGWRLIALPGIKSIQGESTTHVSSKDSEDNVPVWTSVVKSGMNFTIQWGVHNLIYLWGDPENITTLRTPDGSTITLKFPRKNSRYLFKYLKGKKFSVVLPDALRSMRQNRALSAIARSNTTVLSNKLPFQQRTQLGKRLLPSGPVTLHVNNILRSQGYQLTAIAKNPSSNAGHFVSTSLPSQPLQRHANFITSSGIPSAVIHQLQSPSQSISSFSIPSSSTSGTPTIMTISELNTPCGNVLPNSTLTISPINNFSSLSNIKPVQIHQTSPSSPSLVFAYPRNEVQLSTGGRPIRRRRPVPSIIKHSTIDSATSLAQSSSNKVNERTKNL